MPPETLRFEDMIRTLSLPPRSTRRAAFNGRGILRNCKLHELAGSRFTRAFVPKTRFFACGSE
jgi:hypothetical protein